MASRLNLQSDLENLIGSRQVYYQSPESGKMSYPAIVYSLGTPEAKFANDKRYFNMKCYDLIVISRLPEPEVIDKILELPFTSLGKPYVADNLNHYPIRIYY